MHAALLDEAYVASLIPYLSNDDIDKIFLYTWGKYPKLFIYNQNYSASKNQFVSKKALAVLSNRILSGEYDTLFTDYNEWCKFGSVLSKTKYFRKTEVHMNLILDNRPYFFQ